MTYYAHSPKGDIPAQTYEEHVRRVKEQATRHAAAVRAFAPEDGELLYTVVENAATYHDLGKLDAGNQMVLSGKKHAASLPINHVDAGSAHLIAPDTLSSYLAAIVTHAHHIGLADVVHERNNETAAFRDRDVMARVNASLGEMQRIHHALLPETPPSNTKETIKKEHLPVFLRLALSCLADADHSDTARHYQRPTGEGEPIELKPAQRLQRLDDYVAALRSDDPERAALRQNMYVSCRDGAIHTGIAFCDSPVGSGKTTAVMAHLLSQAKARGLRRIIVVLPFTNIITQSVQVYRNALVLPGERPEDVVAELHHRADFINEDARHLTALWRAPIIVTTAVAFFETLSSNATSTLRRLHELPGSAIFVDESHAALPAALLGLAWQWINAFARHWGCYWLLASGSLTKFWEIDEIAKGLKPAVPEIVAPAIRERLSAYETRRIAYEYARAPMDLNEIATWVTGQPGPRLVILNTVQNSAVIASHLNTRFGRERVEHLSSALTPKDREKTLARVKERLKNTQDADWTLVATSCVEAGVDLSFRTGFREVSSLISLLQAAGRVNREGLYSDAVIWSFSLKPNPAFNKNPAFKESSSILAEYFDKGLAISPALSTQSLNDLLQKEGQSTLADFLLERESALCFPDVDEKFCVIASHTQLAVVDAALAKQAECGKVDWRMLQRNSVQISSNILKDMQAPELPGGIYHWQHKYDDFIGYMAGVIALNKLKANSMIL